VAVYVRNNIPCVKAEEGLTGRLQSPSGPVFADLPEDEQIGGYLTLSSESEALELDLEGRAVIVELEPFVLISVYCPAVTTAKREVFRETFITVLEKRAKNLISMGKSVVIAGDINICRGQIDTADPIGAARRTESGIFEDTPSRRWLREFLVPNGPFVDTGRHIHPEREGMYTCAMLTAIHILIGLGWEQRIQARAGNYGKWPPMNE